METELKSAITGLDGKLDGISERVDGIEQKFGGFQKQVDALDLTLQASQRLVSPLANGSAFRKAMEDCDSLRRLQHDKSGKAVLQFKDVAMQEFLQRKATLTETALGAMTTGVMPIDRSPGITPEARQALTIRDLLYSAPTSMQIVDYVHVAPPLPQLASPVPEASLKPENAFNFVSGSERVKLLATWLPASKQVLDDLDGLMAFIQSTLPYYVNLCEELELLSGDGTGEHLHGLIPQSTVFNPSLLPTTGATALDTIGAAIGQIAIAKELPPTFVVLNPVDWTSMRLLKNSFGQYILGDPQTVVSPSLFGLQVVSTVSIAQHTFLVGNGSPIASEIRDRMEMQVEISTEHQDFFVKNLVAIRAEKRLALIVKRPGSYVTGSFEGLSLSAPTNGSGFSPR
ncbi:phage major capsid protein [Acidobacterium sp. S8]|uniref:phage major capsid protein n=1 Tax=Acidobacterium sp. S8 TaxID=1641854 RepID=UPI00131CAEFC|nr:phage major capsid protein [Acidobacterium sp. S8]